MNPQSLPVSCRRMAFAAAVSSFCLLPAAANAAPKPGQIAGEFRVNTTATGDRGDPAIAIDADGDFVVAWVGYVGTSPEIIARRYNAAGVAQGAEFQANTAISGLQYHPAVAIDADGDFVVSWTSYVNYSNEIIARRYNSAGVAQGGEFQVNTTSTNNQFEPSIAIDADGDFVVAWESSVGSGYEIIARRYNAAGAPQSGEFQVSSNVTGTESLPAVAIEADGDFVVAWQSFGFSNEIIARRYNAAGVAQGGQFQVNTTIANDQRTPAIATDADGDFVVTWDSQVDDRFVVMARRYNAAGTPQGGEFQVNTTMSNGQNNPVIAIDADGDFVVAWRRFTGNSDEIIARRYNAAGVAQGAEFRVNTTVAGYRLSPAIALDADGDFVVAWTSEVSGVDEIIARRYQGPNSVDVTLTLTDSADPAPTGSSLTYTINASNLRSPASTTGIAAIDSAIGSATGLQVLDTLPAGSTSVTASGLNWTCPLVQKKGSQTCNYNLPLYAGQQASPLTIRLTPPNTAGVTISNTGKVSANQLDANLPNNTDVEATQLVPTVSFSVATASASEATATTVRVQLSGASTQTVTVPYSRAVLGPNLASFPGDYGLSLPSPITFNPGEVEKLLTITPVDDRVDENNELVSLTLGTPTNALRGSIVNHQRTIVDNDP